MYTIAAFGNALLDITVKIDNNIFLTKYNVKEDEQRELNESDMQNLLNDVSDLPQQVSAGGCAQNTLRVMQWILNKPNSTVFFGAVGNDAQGKILADLLTKDGVVTKYMINTNHNTGCCIALVKNTSRTLIVNISASQYYTQTALEDNKEIFMSAKIIYVEACFIQNRLEVATCILDRCLEYKKLLVFNLSAVYLFEFSPDLIENYAKSCHILFGNRREYEALGTLMKIDNVINLALYLNKNFKSCNESEIFKRHRKIIVVTDGCNMINCVHNDGSITQAAVTQISPELFVDSIAAGDAFVGGFLSACILGHDIANCLTWGDWAAGQIIQQTGCTIPKYSAKLQTEDT